MIYKHDRTLFERAADLADGGTHQRVRVGAVVSKGHRIIASAFNVKGDTPNIPHYLGHAERRVLGAARNKSTMYIARLGIFGGLMPSRPCAECMVAIELSGTIKNIVFWNGHAIVKEKV